MDGMTKRIFRISLSPANTTPRQRKPSTLVFLEASISQLNPVTYVHLLIMAPPSQITIATSSLQRLVKEEASYHKELESQEARLEKLLANKDDDENAEYQLKQEVRLQNFIYHVSLQKDICR
jgi:hypothetical protein